MNSELLFLTSDIVAAHVEYNDVSADALPQLIHSVYQALATADAPPKAEPPAPAKLVPAVPIKRSVFPDYIISLESGRKLKSLKRYLATSYGMTPDDYRRKWGLPADYPMTAPNYTKRRSQVALENGLGRKSQAQKRALRLQNSLTPPPPAPPPQAPRRRSPRPF